MYFKLISKAMNPFEVHIVIQLKLHYLQIRVNIPYIYVKYEYIAILS
jgi:hypothetical protein